MVSEKFLSVVIPVFNEEKTIKKVLTEVLKRKEVYEIIVVDDGSKDASSKIAKSIKTRKIRVITRRVNKGKGNAIRTGLKYARGKLAIIQDADLELRPSDYKKLAQPLLDSRADFVIGNRWKNKKGFLLPMIGGRVLTILVNIIFNARYSDSYCGYKLATPSIWKSLHLCSNRFEIEAEIVARVAQRKLRVAEVEIYYNPRTYKQGKKIKAKDVWLGIKTLLAIRFGRY